MPLIFPISLKKTSFMKFLRKNYIVAIFIVFSLFFLWKQWNKQKIIEKSTFSVTRNFIREMAYIPFLLKKKTVFLRWDVYSSKTAKKEDNLWNFERKIMNCNKKLIYFLLYPSFSIKTWKCKEKKTEKSFF